MLFRSFTDVGYNYRMTNVAAAIGLAQLEQFDSFIARRDEIGARYDKLLGDVSGLTLPARRADVRRVHWLYTVLVEGFSVEQRNALIEAMAAAGVETRPVFYPLHVMPPYLEGGSYPVAERVSAEGISVPTHVGLSDEDTATVCEALTRNVASIRGAGA